MSRPMSRLAAEWVSAPTEMRSTPVWAMARTVSSVTPPLASNYMGVEPDGRLSAPFIEFQRAEVAKWGKVIRDAGIQAE